MSYFCNQSNWSFPENPIKSRDKKQYIMVKKSNFSMLVNFVVCTTVMMFFSSCESEGEKTFEPFSVVYNSNSGNLQSDVVTYVSQRCAEFNQKQFSGQLEKSVAQSKFNDFCIALVAEVQTKNYKVFDNSWAKLQLQNVSGDVVSDKQVIFTKTAEPKRYVSIIFTENAPNGNTQQSTAFIESKLAPYSLTKKTITNKDNIITNTYSLYKEYTTVEEVKNYYDTNNKGLRALIDSIDKQWPASILYTGKLKLSCDFKDETGEFGSNINNSFICHKPTIVNSKWTWETTGQGAPFASIKFSFLSNTAPLPFFATYKIACDGQTNNYIVYRLGSLIEAYDSKTPKYLFKVIDSDNIQLVEINNKTITPIVYTKKVN